MTKKYGFKHGDKFVFDHPCEITIELKNKKGDRGTLVVNPIPVPVHVDRGDTSTHNSKTDTAAER